MRISTLLAAVAICLAQIAVAAGPPDNAPSSPLLFGVLNQQSAIQTAERWNPILRYLTRKTGIPLRLKMGPTVAQTDDMMGREEFDLVFTNHNFEAEFDGKYKVLARWAGKPIHGAIIVLDESTAKTIGDLQGLTVAFPSADAFVAYAVPMVTLKEAGVGVSAKFAGNQEGALAQLKVKQVHAAAVNSRFLESYAQRENLRYRTLHLSEPFHELPVVIHPRVPTDLTATLQRALVGMGDDPDAQAALKECQCDGFEAAADRDYDNVRHIYRTIGK